MEGFLICFSFSFRGAFQIFECDIANNFRNLELLLILKKFKIKLIKLKLIKLIKLIKIIKLIKSIIF